MSKLPKLLLILESFQIAWCYQCHVIMQLYCVISFSSCWPKAQVNRAITVMTDPALLLSVMQCKPAQFTQSPAVAFWQCLFLCIPLSPPSLCSRLSAYRQGCALSTSFRLQSADLPGYTWQWAVKQDMWISPRHNGFVKPTLRQTDGEERTTKVEDVTGGAQWCQWCC